MRVIISLGGWIISGMGWIVAQYFMRQPVMIKGAYINKLNLVRRKGQRGSKFVRTM